VIAASSIPDAGSAERPRVLLADDHSAMLALTADMLSSECFVVGSVGDRCDLLPKAERPHPDVIVLDITMPGLDGIEAARQLKRAGRRAKLVLLTAHKDPDYVRPALHAGGTAYVVEACLASGLITAIHEALVEHSFVSPTISLEENTTTKR
jgi:DNA-binding NarL/FixJ family response regulator